MHGLTPTVRYSWSSSPYTKNPDSLWLVSFAYGDVIVNIGSPSSFIRSCAANSHGFFSSTTPPDSTSCVFNWLESHYPQYYALANKNLLTYGLNSYRYYATTNSLLVYSPKDDILWSSYGTYQRVSVHQFRFVKRLEKWDGV